MPYGIKLKVWGKYACFTRPEMKVERVSYDVITPSAARGILEAIYWKPAIRWAIDRIHVLQPIRFMNIRRNELEGKISISNIKKSMNDSKSPLELFIDELDKNGKLKHRQQRAAMVLRDVDYVIEAHFEYTDRGDHNDGKHLDMFNRRARDGQCFMQPYLGCREFPAHFRLLEDDEPIPASHLHDTQDVGFILHDIDFPNDMQPHFFRAQMNNGIIEIPPFKMEEVKT